MNNLNMHCRVPCKQHYFWKLLSNILQD